MKDNDGMHGTGGPAPLAVAAVTTTPPPDPTFVAPVPADDAEIGTTRVLDRDGQGISLTSELCDARAHAILAETVHGTQLWFEANGNVRILAERPADKTSVAELYTDQRPWVLTDCDAWVVGDLPRLDLAHDRSPLLRMTVVGSPADVARLPVAGQFQANLAALTARLDQARTFDL